MLKPLLLAAALATTAPVARTEPLAVERFGLYVLADDMDRAAEFYARLFGLDPEIRLPALVGFGVQQGLFAIVSRQTYARGVPAGGSVRPYLQVADLPGALQRVRALLPDGVDTGGILREGAFSFFRFTDTEGNVIELFALAPPDRG